MHTIAIINQKIILDSYLGVAAVGSGVVKTGEAVGSAAVSGVTAVGKIKLL